MMVTHQLQVRCRPVKVPRSETDVLPLSHPTNLSFANNSNCCRVQSTFDALQFQWLKTGQVKQRAQGTEASMRVGNLAFSLSTDVTSTDLVSAKGKTKEV